MHKIVDPIFHALNPSGLLIRLLKMFAYSFDFAEIFESAKNSTDSFDFAEIFESAKSTADSKMFQ